MELWNEFVALVDGQKALVIAILILVNIGMAMAAAFKLNTFNVGEVANWLKDRFLAMVVPYFGVGALALVDEQLEFMVPVAFGFIVATLVSKILKNITELGLPLPLPEAIKSRLV